MVDWQDMTIAELLDAGVTPEKIGSYSAEYYAKVVQEKKKQEERKKEIADARAAAIDALNAYFEAKELSIGFQKGTSDNTLANWLEYLMRM